jgi:hypothetical protein
LNQLSEIVFEKKEKNQEIVELVKSSYKKEEIKLRIPVEIKEEDESKRKAGVLFFKGTKENFNKSKKTIKEFNTTFGGVLVAMAHFEEKRLSMDSKTTVVDVDVNYRNRVEPKLGFNHINLLVGMTGTERNIEKSTKFWELSQELSKQLVTDIENDMPLYSLEALEYMIRDKDYFVKHNYGRLGILFL